MAINFYQLAILLGVVLLFVLPIVFVARAAGKRKRAIADGSLQLAEKTNTLSIVGFVLVFFGAVPGIIVSHIALSQIKRTNERGWGLSVAALWIGYASVGSTILLAVAGVLLAQSNVQY